MFFGLKNNKKVKPAKAQKKENKVYVPGDYLFWGEREVLTNEDGVITGKSEGRTKIKILNLLQIYPE